MQCLLQLHSWRRFLLACLAASELLLASRGGQSPPQPSTAQAPQEDSLLQMPCETKQETAAAAAAAEVAAAAAVP